MGLIRRIRGHAPAQGQAQGQAQAQAQVQAPAPAPAPTPAPAPAIDSHTVFSLMGDSLADGAGNRAETQPQGVAGAAYSLAPVIVDDPDFTGGKALSFDGYAAMAEYLDATDALAFAGDFTVEFSAKKTANGLAGYDIVASTYTNPSATDGWWIELSGSRGFFFAARNEQGALNYAGADVPANDGAKHDYALVREGDNLSFYCDRVRVKQQGGFGFPLQAARLWVGNDVSNEHFSGLLGGLKISNVARYSGASY